MHFCSFIRVLMGNELFADKILNMHVIYKQKNFILKLNWLQIEGLNWCFFSFKPQASKYKFLHYHSFRFMYCSILDKAHRMSTTGFSSIHFQSLKLPCWLLGSDTGCQIYVRKENITFLSAKMCPRPTYKRLWQLIFNENEWVMQYWSVAVICQNNMSWAYWGQLRAYLGPVFSSVCSCSAYFFLSLQNVILFVCFSPHWTLQTFCRGHWANNKSGFTRAHLQKW